LEVALTTDGEERDANDATRGIADMMRKMMGMVKKQRRIGQGLVAVRFEGLLLAAEWAPQVAAVLSTL
jgi:hypothetical protein